MKLPEDFINKYKILLKDQADDFFKSLDHDVEKGFRLNSLKYEFKNVEYSLDSPIPFIKNGYYGAIQGNSLEHQSGYVYSQDISAMYVGEVVDAQEGDKVLDLCAAPGGKSTHIAQQLKNSGLLVSNEINHKRAEILVENLERFGAHNVIILNEEPVNIAKTFTSFFDKVVVDAPCSGEGMFRKDHNAVKYWHKNYPTECAIRQKQILTEAIKTLKPGGELIYSTCTFAPEEDEQVVEWILKNYPEFELVDIPKYAGMDAGNPDFGNGNLELTKTVRLMPHHFKGEGQFVAKLKLKEKIIETKKAKKKGKNSLNITNEQLQYFEKLTNELGTTWPKISKKDLKVYDNHLYLYKQDWPDISKLKFMRPGIYLGEFKKKRFEPSYALALALSPLEVERKITISKEQWEIYMTGQTLQIEQSLPNGWYLLICEEKGFSFGKLVGNTIKNFIPKGLRFRK